MSIYSAPPPLRDFKQDKPSLLVCWWMTLMCAVMILLRVSGRFIRTEKLFREDRIAACAIVPLFLRMGCVHYIISNGTNNADFAGAILSSDAMRKKEIASGLVLASRMFLTATLWIYKFAILEFLQRLTGLSWSPAYQKGLIAIRCTLVCTFVAVLISDLAECQPFDHYWQVVPNPGGQCRQGYAWLVTMFTSNIMTDIMLVAFPIPLIITSHMKVTRKAQLALLFSLSLGVVGVSLYRLPHVLWHHGDQTYRSLLASVELLFATVAANALVLGSFVRDRGVKKHKFRQTSVADSFDRTSSNPRRMPTLQRQWGSDEDLVRDMGISLEPELRERQRPTSSIAAATAGNYKLAAPAVKLGDNSEAFQFPKRSGSTVDYSDDYHAVAGREGQQRQGSSSFYDVGGLLEASAGGQGSSDGNQRRGSSQSSSSFPQPAVPPSATHNAGANGLMRGSQALLQDLGGLMSPTTTKLFRGKPSHGGTELSPIRQLGDSPKQYNAHGNPEPALKDPGGLLS